MIKKFDEVFVDKTRLGKKIPKEEYKKKGKYIIIDQGKDKIAGFTDNEDGIFTDVPTIIFGDHTRIIKYIDKPFFLGADGVKVLKSKINNANYKYLYYALKAAYIPNTGYNRHFKWLKKVSINYPSFEKQKRIVKLLDNLSEVKNKKNEELKLCDTLIKARFVEMFGDPIVNPYNFKQEKLERLSCLITKGASPTWQGFNYVEDDDQTLFITSENVKNGYLDLKKSKYVENKFNDKHRRSILQKGDFLINIVGASIGRAAQYSENKLANINQAVALVRLKLNVISSVYLSIYLNSNKALDMYQKMQSNVARANLSLQNIKDLEIILPPIELQNEFASFVQQVDKSKVAIQKSLDETQILFDSLMQKYFS